MAEEPLDPILSSALESSDLDWKKLSNAKLKSEESEAYRFLSSLDLFSKLPEEERRLLAADCHFQSFEAGAYLSHEGEDSSSRGFIVVRGRIALLKTSMNGKEFVVELLSPGDLIGLALTLAPNPLDEQLSARAQTPTKVLWVPKKSFVAALDHHTDIFRDLIGVLVEHLQSSFRLSRGLAHDRVEVRIATVLSILALKFARIPTSLQNGLNNRHTIDITRQQIADLTGTTVESAIRATRAMQRSGLIDISEPGVVRILKLQELEAIEDGND